MRTVNSIFENYKRNIRRKQAAPDAVGTACRGTHSPKERLLLKACRCGKLPQMPAMLPGSECGRKIAAASRCLPLGKDRCFPMPCRWRKVVVPDAVGTACRGAHSPKERLFPADLPPANGFGKTACKHHLSFRKHPRRNQCPSPPAARRYSCAEDSLPQPCCPSGSA